MPQIFKNRFKQPARTPGLPLALMLAITLATLCGSAQAHRPWLLPSSTFVDDKDAWVTVDAAVSEALFDFDHVPLKLDGLSITGPDGAARTPDNVFTGKKRSVFDLKMAQPGTYRISLVQQAVMASYTLNGEAKRWRGSEAALKKEVPADARELTVSRSHTRIETFVTAGKSDFAVFKTTGVGLEMVPLTHPNEARAGDTLRLRLLLDGQPAANLPFSLVPGGVRYRGAANEMRVVTDAKGEASVTLADAGMYWLSASYPLNAAPVAGQRPAPPARRLSYIATFEVLPQ